MITRFSKLADKNINIDYYTPHSGNERDIIYFDNAATSFPKPKTVIDAVNDYLINIGANPGRSGHDLAVRAGRIVFNTRKAIAGLFGLKNPMHVIFGSNATEAINLAIIGLLNKGDHVITTSMEHNSTIRPLKEMEKKGYISLSIARADINGLITVEDLKNEIKPCTVAMVINHVSNVNGCIQPIREIGDLCRKQGLILIADCAQSSGIVPVDINKDNIDILAFSGHKGLYGPTGTGGLVISDNFDHKRIKPLKYGGTGSLSYKTLQPDFLPDCFESGTLNVAGLAGLYEGIRYITEFNGIGVEAVLKHKQELQNHFITTAEKEINNFTSHTLLGMNGAGMVSFRLEGISVSQVAEELSDNFGIFCRSGLHCAPLAHKTLSTFPDGTIRFGFGIFNTKEEVDHAIEVLKKN